MLPILKKTAILLVIIVAIVAVLMGASLWAALKLTEANRWVVHTHQVIEACQQVLSAVQDMEIRFRSYAVVAKSQQRDDYSADFKNYLAAEQRAKTLTADNPVQQRLLGQIETVVRGIDSDARAAFSNGQPASAALLPELFNRHRSLTNSIRLNTATLISNESALLEDRTNKVRTAQFAVWGFTGGLSLSLLGLIGYLFTSTQNYVKREDDQKRQLEKLNESLQAAQQSLQRALHEASESEYDARLANTKLGAVLSSMGEGLYQLDADAQLTYLNPAGEAILGYKFDEIKGAKMHDLIHYQNSSGEVVPAERCPMLRVITDQKTYESHDDVFTTKSGRVINVEYFSAPLIVDGKITGAVVSFQDITARKLADQRLREFYSTLSHELRTPLSSIRASLAMMDQGIVGKLDDEAANLVSISRIECDRLVRLVNNILDLSKIEAGTLDLSLDANDPIALIEQAIDPQKIAAENSGLSLSCKRVEGLPPVWCDADRTIQIIVNLVANAIKFTPKGGSITVGANRQDDGVRFWIQDTGPGIEQKDVYKLFKRFGQLDVPAAARASGTGLGLSICKALVEQQHGQIGLDSALGEGSCFWFTLPLAKENDGGEDSAG